MSEKEKQIGGSLADLDGIEPEADLPGIIGDEWADPEEFLNDFSSDNIEAEIKAKKHLNSPLI
ncbi:MAG: hypothetical protein ACP5VS_00105 [Desulfomonilaceae bacterium]